MMIKTKVFKINTAEGAFLPEEQKALAECAAILRAGGIVAFPTETVYGLGALATNGRAVKSIFEAKGRPQDNPLITHVVSLREAEYLVSDVPPEARLLAKRFWPGPLTMVLKSRGVVAREVTAGLDTLGIRVPAHRVALALIRLAGPLAAPSANRSGLPSTTTAQHVLADLDGRIDAVIDAGPTGVGVESTVLDMTHTPPEVLRHGGVTLEMLREVVPGTRVAETRGQEKPRSPGQKYTHYSPKASVVLVKGQDARSVFASTVRAVEELLWDSHRVGLLSTAESDVLYREKFAGALRDGRLIIMDVGSRGHVEDIASRLFAALRDMDAASVDDIVAEGVQEREIGAAIMDRLGRAASRVINAAHTGKVSFRVLFVCTGNTCRSPLAEAIFRKAAANRPALNVAFEFLSRGTSAEDGEPATREAIASGLESGVNLGSHRARRLTAADCEKADLILTMTAAHKAKVLGDCPGAAKKTFAIAEYLKRPDGDVLDPIGRGIQAYRETVTLLAKYAEVFFGEVLS